MKLKTINEYNKSENIESIEKLKITKRDVIKSIKSIDYDFGYVKARKDHYNTKTLVRKYAIRGGSVGPMTSTSAHLTHNKNAINKIKDILNDAYYDNGFSYDITDNIAKFVIGENKLKITFVLQQYDTNAGRDLDPSYQTFWWVLTK